MALTLYAHKSFTPGGAPMASPRWGEPTVVLYDVPNGNIDSAQITITGSLGTTPTVEVTTNTAADAITNGWRHFFWGMSGTEGKRPTFIVDRSNKDGTPIDAGWVPVLTQDFTTWTQAPSVALNGGTSGTIEFTFTDPLSAGVTYISNNICGTQALADALATDLITTTHSAVCSPNTSADVNGAYRVSQLVNNHNGTQIGGLNQYAIKMDWGGATNDGQPKRHMVVQAMIHAAGEAQQWPAFTAFVYWLLNDASAQAVAMRANWIIHLYFNVNANGVYGGQSRTTPDNGGFGISRVWEIPPTVPVIAETADIQNAIIADLGANSCSWFQGWHGDVYTAAPYNVWVDDLEVTAPSPSYTAVKGAFDTLVSPDVVTVSQANVQNDVWWAREYLQCGGLLSESSAMYTTDITHYTDLGEKWGTAIANADATGVFNSTSDIIINGIIADVVVSPNQGSVVYEIPGDILIDGSIAPVSISTLNGAVLYQTMGDIIIEGIPANIYITAPSGTLIAPDPPITLAQGAYIWL